MSLKKLEKQLANQPYRKIFSTQHWLFQFRHIIEAEVPVDGKFLDGEIKQKTLILYFDIPAKAGSELEIRKFLIVEAGDIFPFGGECLGMIHSNDDNPEKSTGFLFDISHIPS